MGQAGAQNSPQSLKKLRKTLAKIVCCCSERFVSHACNMPALDLPDRVRIQTLHQAGFTQCYIAKEVGVHRSTVKRWSDRHDRYGTVGRGKSSGRPRKMPPAACKRALELLLSGTEGGARFVAQQIYSENLTNGKVSPWTVVRAAKRWAADKGDSLQCLRGRPPKVMTPATRERRLSFAARNKRRSWKHVMITDRCRFYFRFPGSRVFRVRWVLRSAKHADGMFKPNNPMCYNVYAGITRFGVTKLHAVTGTSKLTTGYKNLRGQVAKNITKGEYRDVLNSTLLKEGRRIFSGQGMHGFVLQQDNDPCHTAAREVIQEWNSSAGGGVVQLLHDWPGNSPDLSPIENVWAWVDAEVASKGCTNFDQFCREVDRTFARIPKSMLENLFDSLPKRMQSCLDRAGHKTGF